MYKLTWILPTPLNFRARRKQSCSMGGGGGGGGGVGGEEV